MANSVCRKEFSAALMELAERNPDIYVLTSDARGSAAVAPFAEKFPERFVEAGIAEQNEVGMAAGLALMGKVPFVCAPGAFLSARAVEQVKVDVSYSEKNVKLVGVSAGLAYGASGMTHYAINDFAVFRTMFHMDVLAPADGYQTRELTKAIAKSGRAAYMRMGRNAVPDVYAGEERFEIGKAYKLREGKDLTIIACGKMLHAAVCAADRLEEEGIHARVLDLFTVEPLDREAVVRAAEETKGIITIEEHVRAGGLGEAVVSAVAEKRPAKVKIMALPVEHLVTGSEDEILDYYHLNTEGILAKAREILEGEEG